MTTVKQRKVRSVKTETTMPDLIAPSKVMEIIVRSTSNIETGIKEYVIALNQALLHFHNSGDATLASECVKRLHKGTRVESVKAWFRACAPLKWDTKSGQFVKDKSDDALPIYVITPKNGDVPAVYDDDAIKYIAKGLKVPFYDMFKEPTVTVFDETVARVLKGLTQKYDKALKRDGFTIKDAENITLFMEKVKVLAREAQAFAA